MTLIFADTSSGIFSGDQLQWVADEASRAAPEEVFLFAHHPPVLCDCRFMDDNYSLANLEETWNALSSIPNLKHLFCGHYHTEKTISEGSRTIYLTPSTMMQINQESGEFKIEHTNPWWRSIVIQNGTPVTQVHYE